MVEVIWSPQSLEDLDAIGRFIERDSPSAAQSLIVDIIDHVEHLAKYPESGRVIPEIGQTDCREIIVPPYRIMYRLLGNHLRITGIIHGARNWQP